MEIDRKQLKLDVFKDICLRLSDLSYDPNYHVASIIFTDDFREICAIGFNGNFKNGPHERDSLVAGQSGFLHGEENALLHLTRPFELRDNLIMMCTHRPCPMCAKRIVNANIKRVYYIHEYDRLGDSQHIFDVSNVQIMKV